MLSLRKKSKICSFLLNSFKNNSLGSAGRVLGMLASERWMRGPAKTER